MKLWSVQHRDAYEELNRTGILHANEQYLFCEDEFRFAYDWLSEQMVQRVGKSPKGVRYPIWAWYQWEGERKRLDMRKHRRWSNRGTPIVLLTLDVPEEQVLLSDFDQWHFVLSNSYLPLAQEENDDAPEEQIRKSWERIFDWDCELPTGALPRSTQATFWELRKEWVQKAENFISI